VAAIRIADWRATRLRDPPTGSVNHAEPATPCGNVVDPRELSGDAPSRDGTFRTVVRSLSDWTCRQGMGTGVPKK